MADNNVLQGKINTANYSQQIIPDSIASCRYHMLHSKKLHGPFFSSNLPCVSFLKRVVLICLFPSKSQNENKWKYEKLPAKSKSST